MKIEITKEEAEAVLLNYVKEDMGLKNHFDPEAYTYVVEKDYSNEFKIEIMENGNDKNN